MRHVFERNRARGTGLFTRRVIAAVATVAMLAGVGCVTASSAAAEDATGALEQQIEQPVLQESGQEDSQPVEQNLMVGEEQPSEQEQPSDQEAYQQVEQETEQETEEETEQWVEQEVEQQSEQQSEQPDEQPVTLSAQPIARANRAQSVAQNETGSQLGAPEKHKRIKKNNDGSYTVNVDVKGAASSTTVTTTQPIDFTLVLDVSGSMDDPMSKTDRTRRLDALKEAVKAFLDEAANTNTEAGSELVRVGLVKFAGNEKDKIGDDTYRSGGYTYNYSQIVSDLTADMNGLKNKVSKLKAAGATRADNGFNLAAKMMGSARTDAKKVVIFFTDGSPTSSSGFEGKVANKAVEAAKELKDGGATVYSIGVFSGADPSSIQGNENQFMHAVSSNFPKATKYNQRGEGNIKAGYYKSATNASELNAIFDEIEKSETTTSAYTKVTMEDTLSGYVELADNNYRVVAKDASGKVVSLTNVDYTLTYDASTKKFTVAFLKALAHNVTYTLEYNVKPTQKAYDEYAANLNAGKDGYDGVKGNANTDLPGNATSSNQPGFHTNDSACLTYTADGKTHECRENPYPHPVVQVVSSTLHIDKQWSGNGQKPESITVDIKQGNDTYKTVTLKRDDSGKWSTDVIIPAGAQKTYTVTEVEPDSHLWKASYQHKVGDGNLADGNVVTVPESMASQNATVVITNTLKQTMLTHAIGVQKELVGRDWKDSDEFTFKLKADDSNPDAPMPASCKNQSACTVTVKRDSSDDHVAYFGDITYNAGEAEYTYLVTEDAGDASAMYYSQAEYRVVVSVMKDGTSGEWKAVVESVTQLKTDYGAAGSNWDETQPMLFTNQYISASSLPLTGRMGAERWWQIAAGGVGVLALLAVAAADQWRRKKRLS
ncbi:VWA domain-containing protein [Bifidobacterium adolescentis]|nr:VWA domain-containing protein [Bifidobacterium adolescentis]